MEKRNVPDYSCFPEEEFRERWNKLSAYMQEKGIDLFLLTQKGNVEYLCGLMTAAWGSKTNPFVLLLTDDNSCLLVPAWLRGTAARSSWAHSVIGWSQSYTKPFDLVDVVVRTVRDLKRERATIGIEAGPYSRLGIGLSILDAIKEKLPHAQFVDGSGIIDTLRMVKSAREIKKMERAAEITCRALEVCFDTLKPGMSEKDIARIIRKVSVDEGADLPWITGRTTTRAWQSLALPDRFNLASAYPSDRPIPEGSIILVDAGVSYEGYVTDMCRYAYVGEPSDELAELLDLAIRANEAARSAVKPGQKLREMHNAAMTVFNSSRWRDAVGGMDVGHGVGIDVHEQPFIGSKSEGVFQVGMVIASEPSLWEPRKYGAIFVEDEIVITESGNRLLTPIPREFYKIKS